MIDRRKGEATRASLTYPGLHELAVNKRFCARDSFIDCPEMRQGASRGSSCFPCSSPQVGVWLMRVHSGCPFQRTIRSRGQLMFGRREI